MRAIIERNGPVGEIIQGADTDKLKLVATKGKRWSGAAEDIFIETLAATCNVTRSAAACGFSTVIAYRRRLKHAGFAERWKVALENGYTRLELAVVEAANDTMAGEAFAPDRPIPQMTVKEVLSVLQLHKATVRHGQPSGSRWRLKPADPDRARANILKRVAAVRKADARASAQPLA